VVPNKLLCESYRVDKQQNENCIYYSSGMYYAKIQLFKLVACHDASAGIYKYGCLP
jgi:hypothetical protein